MHLHQTCPLLHAGSGHPWDPEMRPIVLECNGSHPLERMRLGRDVAFQVHVGGRCRMCWNPKESQQRTNNYLRELTFSHLLVCLLFQPVIVCHLVIWNLISPVCRRGCLRSQIGSPLQCLCGAFHLLLHLCNVLVHVNVDVGLRGTVEPPALPFLIPAASVGIDGAPPRSHRAQ